MGQWLLRKMNARKEEIIMKRAMSLLLTLAMVMSFFTVGAFAEGESLSVDPDAATIVAGGATELTATATYTKDETKNESDQLKFSYAETYAWTVTKDGEASTDLTITKGTGANKNKATVTAKSSAEGEYIVTCAVAVAVSKTSAAAEEDVAPANPEIPTTTATITVEKDNYELKILKIEDSTAATAQTVSLAPNGTAELTVKAELWDKGTPAEGETPAVEAKKVADAPAATVTVKDTTVATLADGTVTAKAKGGSTTIEASVEYMGKTYTKTLANITVKSLGIEKKMDNGDAVTFPADSASNTTSIVDLIAADLKSATGAETAPTVSTVKLTVPSSSIFTAYKDTKKTDNKLAAGEHTLDLTKALIIEATAGSVKTEEWTYKATVGETVYEGTLTLVSEYAGNTITDTQTADFTEEWFFLESVGNSITHIRDYVSGNTTYPAEADLVKVTDKKIYPSTHTGDWTENFIGYDRNKVAYLVDVKFTLPTYDILTYAEDGEEPFVFSDFQAFAEAVAYEQEEYYDVDVAYVQFTKAYDSGKWELMSGTKRISTSGTASKLTATELEAVYVDVKTAGVYSVPFKVYFDYQTSSSSKWTTSASKTYEGNVTLYVTAEGDIKYDVSYGEAVTFDTADFQAYLRSASGKSNAKVKSVIFGDQPLYGGLYTVPNKSTNTYLVDSSDTFYADPTGSQYDLADVTYRADNYPRTEYSVYIPFTVYPTSGSGQSGIVEIVVNGSLPFTDVKETDTFYSYIKYVYDKGIMNGKSATKFDAKSSVTRAQLVVTLYRMAGSPTTYDRKTLPFTDTTKLSAEFTSALKWAVNSGIVNGYGDVFKPNDAVTRQAMVTILYRFANDCGYDTSVVSSNNLAAYKDAAKVSSSMKTAMNWAVDCGFVSGTSGKLLNPQGSTTRGACAKILATFHDWYIG